MKYHRLAVWALFIGLGLVVAFAPLPAGQPAMQEVQLEARMFEFSPNVIRVDRGDRVVIDLAAMGSQARSRLWLIRPASSASAAPPVVDAVSRRHSAFLTNAPPGGDVLSPG